MVYTICFCYAAEKTENRFDFTVYRRIGRKLRGNWIVGKRRTTIVETQYPAACHTHDCDVCKWHGPLAKRIHDYRTVLKIEKI